MFILSGADHFQATREPLTILRALGSGRAQKNADGIDLGASDRIRSLTSLAKDRTRKLTAVQSDLDECWLYKNQREPGRQSNVQVNIGDPFHMWTVEFTHLPK